MACLWQSEEVVNPNSVLSDDAASHGHRHMDNGAAHGLLQAVALGRALVRKRRTRSAREHGGP